MTQVGDKQIGFFYTKDKNTFCEKGGTYTIENPYEYAVTSTGYVVLLIDSEGNILDIDDVPSEESFNRCGENFIAFVQDGDTYGFVIGKGSFDLMNTKQINDGLITYLDIVSEDFDLKATFDLDNTDNILNLKEDSLILVTSEVPPKTKDNEVVLFMASLKIVNFC